jgi:hypothetical protein
LSGGACEVRNSLHRLSLYYTLSYVTFAVVKIAEKVQIAALNIDAASSATYLGTDSH